MNKTSSEKRGSFTGLIAMVIAIMMAIPMILNSESFAAPKKPGTVTLTKISASAYNKIKIDWKKASGATHYKIYYRKAGTKKWNFVKTINSKSSSYTHTSNKSDPIIVGQKYDYTVRGYNSKTKQSGKYNTKGLTSYTRPETVKLKKATLGVFEDSAVISWNKARGCDKYKIYRKSGSQWKLIDTVSSNQTNYTDFNPQIGKKNTYTVRAYYSKTKVNGKYNSKGISIYIPNTTDWPGNEDVNPTPTPDLPLSQEELDAMAREVLRLTNIEREKVGKNPLVFHPALQKGAMVRAKEISYHFSHTRPDGTSGDTAAEAFGVGDLSGENIANGYPTPEDVIYGWMNSPGHRDTMLHTWHKYIGIGCYEDSNGKLYWVQTFAGPKANDTVTLTFNPNGGICDIKTMEVPYKKRMYQRELPVPVRNGYRFIGWGTFNNEHPFTACVVDSDETFRALWEKA